MKEFLEVFEVCLKLELLFNFDHLNMMCFKNLRL